MEQPYIIAMSGRVQKQRGYGQDGLELVVAITFDAKQFNKIKQKSCPLSAGMAQIKNVVFDATGIRGLPSYAAVSMGQRFPRASKGKISLLVYFDCSDFTAKLLKVDTTKTWGLYHPVNLQSALEQTQNDGHLFAKTAIASMMGH